MLKQLVRLLTLAVLVTCVVAGRAAIAADTETHATGAAATHDAANHDAGAHEKGEIMPEATRSDSIFQALWVIAIFLIMLAILYPTAWKNVLAGLKKREERIRKDIADAEAARLRSESTLKEYNAQLAAAEARGRENLNKATTDAEALATNIRNRAQQESEEIKDLATKDIEAARAQAVADVHRQAAELATLVAEKILRRNLNTSDQEDLVRQSLDQMQTVSKN